MIDTTSILGYAKPWSVAPGETVAFHLASEFLDSAAIRVVRVRCADPDENGPGLKLHHVASSLDGTVALSPPTVQTGSFVQIPDIALLKHLNEFSIGLWIYPTRVGAGSQTIISRWNGRLDCGWKLALDADGALSIVIAGNGARASARTNGSVLNREWIFVTASYSGSHGKLEISATSLATDGGRARSLVGSAAAPAGCRWPASTPLILAAEWPGDGAENARAAKHFNGKIDRPRLYAKAVSADFMRSLVESLHPSPADPDLLAAWDFSSDMSSDTCWDISAHALHGEAHHLPMRAATGANWTGQVQSWKEDPTQYGAIHFHDDDLEDVGWAASCEYEIPADLKSGFYSLEATGEVDGRKVESHTIFFVRPPAGKRTADVLVIAPTATYLAYANNHSRIDQTHFEVMADGLMVLSQDDLFTHAHREFGMSLYDTHSDLSGSCYSSAARPIINGRPRSSTFNYVNDTHFLDWLEEERVGYDVVTDEDIHRKGASLLASYPVVVNMTHPEYYSREMLDALTAYQNGGGRHMYLGGNGFYWRVTFHPKKQGVIELRRGITGLRSWEAEAGEGSLSFTGEPSGLWRSSGRAPQRLCGVGFSAQVFDHSGSYRRLADSFDPRAAFVFDGIGDDEVIGNFGLRLGGAAGLEIDRSDRDLGSPPEMLVLATADQMGPGGIPAPEELPALYRGFTGEESNIARADIVLCPTDKGGAVFSTGSIAWCCALSHNGYDNNVSRMTRNVLRRFMDPSPLDLSESGRERTR